MEHIKLHLSSLHDQSPDRNITQQFSNVTELKLCFCYNAGNCIKLKRRMKLVLIQIT